MSAATIEQLYQDALAFLLGRIDYERAAMVPYGAREFKLDRMRELLARLGQPDAGLKIVHVAGTKGKGSTAAMISALLTAAGYRTGLFTSPHLDRIEERLAIAGQPCSAEQLVQLVEAVRPAAEQMDRQADSGGPTYFEMNTALALLHFAQQQLDAAVLEVGLGGRLDSTNVCQPLVSIITSISFDHTLQLGNTLAAIAQEKAGIIKPHIPVVSGVTALEPREIIQATCRAQHSPLVELGADFDFDYRPPRAVDRVAGQGLMDFHYRLPGREHDYRDLALGLLGRHQAANAAVSLSAVAELSQQGWQIPEAAIRSGLAELRWPARVEVIARRPTIILDAAHNVASVQALVETLEESFAPRRRVLILGATGREKEVRGMLEVLLPHFEKVIFTRYQKNLRAMLPDEVMALAEAWPGGERVIRPDPASAWQEACAGLTADDLVCITGSFFIAAEMRQEIYSTTSH